MEFDPINLVNMSVCAAAVILSLAFGISVLLGGGNKPDEDISSKDVDKVVNYMKDHKLESCKINLSKRDIEIFSDETNAVRKSNRNSRVNRYIEEKKVNNEDNSMTPLMTTIVVNDLLNPNNECESGNDSSESGFCDNSGMNHSSNNIDSSSTYDYSSSSSNSSNSSYDSSSSNDSSSW
ncbi:MULTISPECIES: hypothetical protein [Bacillus cereus group]|uniref:hypothetical protein n=1 Tax=Bacillus cereus group TaxID=86661 RepID=UPI00188335F8|nr:MULTISPECIES: hypothetical protein [Bacillus cereus group]MDX5828925.1 hypothetical protein [Bacillus cereus group sp. BfR-BA-02147]